MRWAIGVILLLGAGVLVAFAWNNPTLAPPQDSAAVTTKDADPSPTVLNKYIGIGETDPQDRLQISAGNFLQDTPSDPKQVGSISIIPDAVGVGGAVAGNYAYFVARVSASPYASRFRIVDTSMPSAPAVIGGSNLDGALPANVTGVSVAGRYAYLVFDTTTGTNVFRVVDIGNPASPQVMPVGSLSLGPGATDIAVAGPYAYITFRTLAYGAPQLVIVDVTDPANPAVRGQLFIPSDVSFLDRFRRFLAQVVVSVPYTDVFIVGQYAYLVGENKFQIVDVANPSAPAILGSLILNGIATDVFVSNRYAYVTAGDNLEIISVSNPNAPTRCPTCTVSLDTARSVSVAGRYAYVGFGGGDVNFAIVDMVNPSSPSPKLVVETAFSVVSEHIVLGGRYAYLFGYETTPAARFGVIDIPGIEAVSGKVRALTAGSLSVRDQAQIGGALRVTQDLEIGGHALFNGNVEIGTVASPRNLRIKGLLSKGGGSFEIDHPLDPLNKILRHSFVESPDMKNIYDGIAMLDVRGEAIVKLPDYFEALNRDYRYQLSGVDAPMPDLYIKSEVNGNRFLIGGGTPFGEVSWQVTGTRKDPFAEARRIVVEETKPKPGYLYPELYLGGQHGKQAK